MPSARNTRSGEPLLEAYVQCLKTYLTCWGKLRLERSFTPANCNNPPPTTAKLANTALAPNLYLLLAVVLDKKGRDHHDAELLARGWVNATIGDAFLTFGDSPAGKQFNWSFELGGQSDHALRLGNDAINNPRWRVQWNENWWDPVQAIAADHLPHASPTTSDKPTQVWVVVGTPEVDVKRFSEDRSGNTLADYASAMEAIRLGYEGLLGRNWVSM